MHTNGGNRYTEKIFEAAVQLASDEKQHKDPKPLPRLELEQGQSTVTPEHIQQGQTPSPRVILEDTLVEVPKQAPHIISYDTC